MAIDFSRALKVRKGGVTYTHYGQDTAPSEHYLAFRSQGATRYLPLTTHDPKALPKPVIFTRVGNANLCVSYGMMYSLSFTTTEYSIFSVYRNIGLNTIKNNRGGSNFATTVTIEILNSGGGVTKTQTVTFDANTSSQSYNIAIVLSVSQSSISKIRVTISVNGKSVTTTSNVSVGDQTVSIAIPTAPF